MIFATHKKHYNLCITTLMHHHVLCIITSYASLRLIHTSCIWRPFIYYLMSRTQQQDPPTHSVPSPSIRIDPKIRYSPTKKTLTSSRGSKRLKWRTSNRRPPINRVASASRPLKQWPKSKCLKSWRCKIALSLS